MQQLRVKIFTFSIGFIIDARSVILKMEENTVHEVCNTLKRFLRNLHDPLLTDHLYGQWIATAGKFNFYSLGIEASESVDLSLCVYLPGCVYLWNIYHTR